MATKITYANGSNLAPSQLNNFFGTDAATGHVHSGIDDQTSAPKIDLTAHVTDRLPFMNAIAPNGYISGLEMFFPSLLPVTNAVPTDSVSFNAGSCTVQDVSGNKIFVTAPAGTKVLASGWTAGTGGNGLPAAVSLANAWYFVYLIVYADGVTCDWGFSSTSPTALLAASGAVYYRRLGSVWYQGGTDKIRQFRQTGNEFRFASAPGTSTSTLTGGTQVLIGGLSVPLNVNVQAILSIYGFGPNGATATCSWLAGDWDENNLHVGQYCNHSTFSGDPGPMIVYCWTNTVGQIQYATAYGSTLTTTIQIYTKGYIDLRL